MDSKNSLSSIIDNLVRLQKNNNNVLLSLNDMLNSSNDVVELEIEDIKDGVMKQVTLPSFNSIKKDIERLDNNIKQLSNFDGSATVRLKDGTYRNIFTSTVKNTPKDLGTSIAPSTFSNKNNWFFESFLNPYLFVTYNFSNISSNSKEVLSQKFILNLDTPSKVQYFNENYLGNNSIDYNDFIDDISEQGITYMLDEDVVKLPFRSKEFYGDFSVIRVFNDVIETTINNEIVDKKVVKIMLDKLTYNDINASNIDSKQLKINDSILVNTNKKNTRYKIIDINVEESTISVELIEGYDPISIGVNVLSYYDNRELKPSVEVGIGFNEYIVQFVKDIDANSNITSDNWSSGCALYTNDLTINDNGVIKTLSTYYNETVVDFGATLLSIANENIPPSSKGIIPNVVEFTDTLNPSEFKVVQINKHSTDVSANEDIKNLNKDKNSLKEELNEVDKTIKEFRLEVSTKTYKTDSERQTDINKLKNLIDRRTTVDTLYNTIVRDIITKGSDKNTNASKPKYRVRGFFTTPIDKVSSDGSIQHIIQYMIEYRYLTKNGGANNLEEFNRDENENSVKGVFSNWVQVKTPLRERAYNESIGQYYWVDNNTENGDALNINQIDIPIQENESVEIRIKSISEAGYPSNPMISNYSEIVKIDFPDSLGSDKSVLDIVKEATNEDINIKLKEDLVALGLNEHLSTQFTQNGNLYAHSSTHIASGFLSDEQNVKSLFEVLKTMQSKIDELESIVNKALGELVVKIEDDLGNQKIIQNNTTTSLFAGNYKDLVADLDKPKGVIVAKNYFLRIENNSTTPIELYSILSGSKLTRTTDNKYSNVAIGLSNPLQSDLDNIIDNGTASNLPFQSSQVNGQFIYVRNKDITNTKSLVNTDTSIGDTGNISSSQNKFDKSITNGISTNNYVVDNSFFAWNGSETVDNITNVGNGIINGIEGINILDDNIYVHAEHPTLQQGLSIPNINSFIDSNTTVSKYASLDKTSNSSNYFTHSPFYRNGLNNTTKISFTDDDKYLIGSPSCGCYFFMSPSSYDDVRVNGNDDISIKSVEYGTSKGLSIQLVYQFRMTDYYGGGTSGIGRIGGKNGITQLEYQKSLGFDLFYDESKISFDIEVLSRYKSNSISTNDIPTLTYQNTFNKAKSILSNLG